MKVVSKRFLKHFCIMGLVILVVIVVAGATAAIAIPASNSARSAAEAEIADAYRNAGSLLDIRGKKGLECIYNDDWGGFTDLYQADAFWFENDGKPTVYITSDLFDGQIVLAINNNANTVDMIQVMRNALPFYQPFGIHEPSAITVHTQGNKEFRFTPTSAAYLCKIMSQLTADAET